MFRYYDKTAQLERDLRETRQQLAAMQPVVTFIQARDQDFAKYEKDLEKFKTEITDAEEPEEER